VRPLTYENAAEVAFLKSVYARQGSLENTSFGILAPDGETHLVRSGRSPTRIFRSPENMAQEMHKLAGKFKDKKKVTPPDLGLPLMESTRFALNTAACDTQLLAIVHAPEADTRARLEAALTPVAWSEGVIGNFLYASNADPKALECVKQSKAKPGVLLVKPGVFGLTGKLIAHVPADAPEGELRGAMLAACAKNQGYSKDSRRHLSEARAVKASWSSATGMQEDSRRGRSSSRRRGSSRRGQDSQSRRRGSRRGRDTRRGGEEARRAGQGASGETRKSGEAKKSEEAKKSAGKSGK